ncbi:hypothetical protein KY333_02905 [Candidatus Woesearchaeota archaeon]|nr:hypothetical protein [Candidatus Woesearchaeota archaeon]MBW2994685.1 hypothetical protein [Candidatus Woesearchaeota archaeon]
MTINKVLPNSNLAKYIGEWVVICKNEVVAHNKDIAKLKKEINKCKTTPTIAKIPKKEILIF